MTGAGTMSSVLAIHLEGRMLDCMNMELTNSAEAVLTISAAKPTSMCWHARPSTMQNQMQHESKHIKNLNTCVRPRSEIGTVSQTESGGTRISACTYQMKSELMHQRAQTSARHSEEVSRRERFTKCFSGTIEDRSTRKGDTTNMQVGRIHDVRAYSGQVGLTRVSI